MFPIAAGSSSDVKKRPSVGTSHSRPMNARSRYTGVFVRNLTTLDDIGSEVSAESATGTSIGAVVVDT